MKVYLYEGLTAVALLSVAEAYFWSQSRSLTSNNGTQKIALLALYALIACISQYALSSKLKYSLPAALKANLLLAMLLSFGTTLLAFSIHQGIVKDAPEDVSSIAASSLKFFLTLGLATLGLRMIVAALVRLRRSVAP